MARRNRRDVQQRKDLKKLERLGLYKPKTDQVTSYGKKQISRFAGVLSGRETVVKATEKAARRYKRQGFKTHGDKVVVPQPPSTHPHFSKVSREITVQVRHHGETRRAVVQPVRAGNDIEQLRRIDTSKYYLSLPLQRFGRRHIDYMNYEDADELINDITQYARKPDLLSYVILVPKQSGRIPKSSGSSRKFPHASRGSRVGDDE